MVRFIPHPFQFTIAAPHSTLVNTMKCMESLSCRILN